MNQPQSIEYPAFRWFVLFMIAIATASAGLMAASFPPLIVEISKSLGIDQGTASFDFISLNFAGTALSLLISGFLIDRLGVLKVVLWSVLLMALSQASLIFLDGSVIGVTISRVIVGLALAPCMIATAPILQQWFPRREMGIASALHTVSLFSGVMAAYTASPYAFKLIDNWSYAQASLAVVPFIGFVIACVVFIYSLRHQPPVVLTEMSNKAGSDKKFSLIKQLLRNPTFWVGLCFMCGSQWVQKVSDSLIPGYLAADPPIGIGYGSITAGRLMSLVPFAGVIAALLGGIMLDKVFGGKNRTLIILGSITYVFAFLGIKIPFVYGNTSLLVVFLLLAGIGTPITAPTLVGYVAKSFPTTLAATVQGLWQFCGVIIGTLAVMLGSLLLRTTGSHSLILTIQVVISIVTVICSLFLKAPPEETAPAKAE
jgi:MFS transporter, ACS family, glucarate transporter